MKTFYQFLENINLVTVDVEKYKTSVENLLSDLEDYTQSEKQRLANFKFDRNIVATNLQNIQYPDTQGILNLIDDITSGKAEVWDLLHKDRELHKWLLDQFHQPNYTQKSNAVHIISSALMDLEKKLYYEMPREEQNDGETLENLVVQTTANMQKVAQKMQEAISRIENWNKSSVVVQAPKQDKNSNWLEPEESAYIEMKHPENTWDVGFAYWGDQIEDVLDAGDDEFFNSNKLQEDYFNLINELRKPGSTSKGKITTVYTARPKQDREIYSKAQETKQIPANLFVTSDFNNAVDLMQDLPGDKNRDVWKIRINSKYLILTNDDRIKHYQIKGTGTVPVVSIDLVYTS